MRKSESLANLAPALVKAQAELKAIGKDSTNPDFRSKYASLDNIIESVRPVLARHGLALLQGVVMPDDDDMTGRMSTFAVESSILHTSGEWIATTVQMPVVGRQKSKQDGGGFGEVTPQAAGSALTYGRRYGLAALLCLATDEDDDGRAASKPSTAARTPAKSQTPVTDAVAASAASRVKPETRGAVPIITRESKITWGSLEGTAIKDLADDYLAWGIQDGRKFGPDTRAWQIALADERAHRSREGIEPRAPTPEDAGQYIQSVSNDAGPGDLPDLGF